MQTLFALGVTESREPVEGLLMDPGAEASELAVETLLADLALTRLGTLLRTAREKRSDSRRAVANQVGTSARALRRYETGAVPVPNGIVTALAQFYGEDLNTHFAHRTPAQIDTSRVVDPIEQARVHSGDADEALGAYIGILGRDPLLARDAPVSLRDDDIAVLASALAVEPADVKGRIAELLALNTRLRRNNKRRHRRRILSGAGLAIVLATSAGFGVGALIGALPSPAESGGSPVTAAPTTVSAPPKTVATPPATAAARPVAVAPNTEAPTPSTVIAAAVTPIVQTTTTFLRPVISPDTTPISVPGTEPITIITSP